MLLISALLFICLMGVLSRMAGGGFGAPYLQSKGLGGVPEILLAIPFGVAAGYAASLYIALPYAIAIGIASFAWSWAWMESATAPGLHWGNGGYNPNRTSTLKPFVDLLNKYTLKADPSSEAYCWLYMGMKGFLIGLPVGGLPLAILWPMGYEAGDQLLDRGITKPEPGAFREFVAGLGAGVSIVLFLVLITLL